MAQVTLSELLCHWYPMVPERGTGREPDKVPAGFPAHTVCEPVIELFDTPSQPVFATKTFLPAKFSKVMDPNDTLFAFSPHA